MPLAVFADPKVIEGAKKEGELAWWSTIAQDQSQKIVDEFMKRYPFIKANYWRSGSVGLHNKILIEARAGRSSWDVVSQTTPEFIYELKQKKLITAYNSPERSHFSTDLKDKDGYWTGTYALPTGLGFNTQQVKKEEAPKSYKDLLDSRWKGGKISIDDENYELLVGLVEAWGKNAAVEYLKGLAAQAPVVGRGLPNERRCWRRASSRSRSHTRIRSNGQSPRVPRWIGSTSSRW